MSQAGIANKTIKPGACNITLTAGSGIVISGSPVTCGSTATISATGTVQPNNVVFLYDDFFPSKNLSSVNIGQLRWVAIDTASVITTISANNPGICEIDSSFTANGIILNDDLNVQYGLILGGGVTTFNFVVNLVTLSTGANRYVCQIGYSDNSNSSYSPTQNGVYFSYSDNVNSGNWVLNCTKAGTTTSSNTSVPAAVGFNTFTAQVNAAGTRVTFFINNGAVGSAIVTNIPTVALNPYVLFNPSAGSSPNALVDLFWLTVALSNPRPGPVGPAGSGTTGTLIENYTPTAISYQVLGTDAIIGVTSTSAPRTITMPNPAQAGQRWTITDESGGAATNNITISGNGLNIDGSATYIINLNYGSIDIYSNGTAFFII